MKQNPDYILRNVADSLVIVPTGEATKDFPGMITVNPTSQFLWEQLAVDQTAETLVAALLSKYDVPEDLARKDVEKFLETMTLIGAVIA